MKKYLLITAIAFISVFTACHKTTTSTPAPAAAVTDSVTFAVTKVTGDTISTYTATKYGTFSFNIKAFQAKNGLTGQHLTVVYKAIDQTGTFQYAGKTVTSDTITTGLGYDVNYFPVAVKGNQRISVSITDAAGKSYADTINFYVKTYQPVPFTVTFNTKSFPSEAAISNFTFYFYVASSDPTNTMKYYYEYNTLIVPANYTGTTLIQDTNQNTYISPDTQYNLSISTYEYIKISLASVTAGTYKLPMKIYDANGDFKLDTITYVVQ